MIIAGIIAEYDPFHTGHKYHIEQTRMRCGADAVICIMSASFVQRGRPACFDKFARARAAAENGADIVLELPAAASLQSAEYFALSAVRRLAACGLITHLSFGTEAPLPAPEGSKNAQGAAQALFARTEDSLLRARLQAGLPYNRAASQSSAQTPNAMLGAEYMRAAEAVGFHPEFIGIPRRGAGHGQLEGREHKSGTGLRQLLAENQSPAECLVSGGRFLDPESMIIPLLCRLRTMSTQELAGISQISEGLEYRIAQAARSCACLDELILACKSKRYTYSRLSRALCCAFLGITKEMSARAAERTDYLRVLALRKEALPLLSLLCKKSAVPVCVKSAEFLRRSPREAAEAFRAECLATDLRAALELASGGQDFTRGLIIV